MCANKIKVTYATISADNEELQSAYDVAIEEVGKSCLGLTHKMYIDGKWVEAGGTFDVFTPVDTDIKLGTFQKGDREHVKKAIAAARAAFDGWRATPYEKRAKIILDAAEMISDDSLRLSAIMIMEVGKNRLEALGEVEETADLLRYYGNDMLKNKGYLRELGRLSDKERNYSALCPFGVWAVISPFNFPMALTAAPIAAALVTGNTCVFKCSSTTPYTGVKLMEIFEKAGVPKGVLNMVTGPGSTVGQELQDNPGIDGITFTGSYDVGMRIYRNFGKDYPKPVIVEMGGKNPAIVSNKADLTKATMGVMRAAFGLDGQKCSACSRVYVHEDVYDEFKAKLVEMTSAIKVGHPNDRAVYMGTVIDKGAYESYKKYAEIARRDGNVLTGGKVLTEGDFARGYYVTPTIVEGLPEDHELVKTELFVPILFLGKCKDVDDGLKRANDTVYGLTAGFYSEDQAEVDEFVRRIESGTIYINRAAGATTGAWPGIQAFGGWKGSGASFKGIGSFYTLPLYMHEQSRTFIIS